MKRSNLIFLGIATLALVAVGCGGGGTGTNGGGISTTPTLTGINPKTAPLNKAVTVNVFGANFLHGVQVLFNGQPRTTHEFNSGHVSVDILASDTTTNSVVPITVKNPNDIVSNAVNLTVGNNNPVPTLTSLSPSSIAHGFGPTSIKVFGTNFASGAYVQINAQKRNTLYVSNTEVDAQVLAADDAAPSTLTVSVVNVGPGGGVSNNLNLTIK